MARRVVSKPGQAPPPPTGTATLTRATAITFARSSVRGVETAITFAGQEPAFLMQLSGAEVPSVSMGAVQGRAVVMVVSRSRVSAVAVVTAVSLGDYELTGSGTAVPKQMMTAVRHAVRS